MNRAMFSGVAGLKTHQTKMDVIGNNIANVNTYGYKAQRAVFSDIFYQTVSSASAGTSNRGGTNPSSVGYGSKLAAVQTQMTQSSMQSTGFGLDVAITGEGFFQVMDPDGNIFYTKAGLLDYDSNGYLTDINGNFVLGTPTADGKPDKQKLKLDNVGSVTPEKASLKATANGIEYTLSASNSTSMGNVSIKFGASDELPSPLKAKASISTTGAITVQLSKTAKFTSIDEMNKAINTAITEANGGKPHTAGDFTLTSAEGAKKFAVPGGISGAEICGTDFSVQDGDVVGAPLFGGYMEVKGTNTAFDGNGTITNPDDFTATYDKGDPAKKIPASWKISMTVSGKTFTGVVSEGEMAQSFLLQSADEKSNIEMSNPTFDKLMTLYKAANGGVAPTGTGAEKINAFENGKTLTVTPAKPSNDLGISAIAFNLAGGTEGGPITLDQLTSIAIGSDGTISVSHPSKGTVAAGKVSLANFANASGLQQEGANYYAETVNSGKAKLCNAGSDGTGGLVSNALEMSNVDLSAEFADMITTQRGFQANSRIITVSDTMLEELINLKR
ncbi:MAG: flagellar hook-basal body complex protein [Oscillospiraceae bacterium]